MRLDYYELKPAGLGPYLSHYGYHISKALCKWAVGKMRDRKGERVKMIERDNLDASLRQIGISLENDEAYDAVYVYLMGRADFLASSIPDEHHLLKFVKDYLDDPDGADSRAFDELVAKMNAKGVPISWEDMI